MGVINSSSEKYDSKNLRKIALNVLYAKKEKKYSAYVSQDNFNRKKASYSFSNFKWRKAMALSCSKKTISNIKRNRV